MNDRDQRRHDRLTRVQTFGKNNASDFVADSTAAGFFASLDTLVANFELTKTTQVPNRVSKLFVLDALLLDFKNIARTARAIDIGEHGFAVGYRVPDSLTEATSITHADALLGRLEDSPDDTPKQLADKTTLRAKFAAYELGDGFVADLRADRDALKNVKQSNQAETQVGVESTAELTALLGEGQKLMLHLDAVMNNKYRGVPQKLREWQSASHVERSPRYTQAEPTVTPAPAALVAA